MSQKQHQPEQLPAKGFSVGDLCYCLTKGCRSLLSIESDSDSHHELRNLEITSEGNQTERHAGQTEDNGRISNATTNPFVQANNAAPKTKKSPSKLAKILKMLGVRQRENNHFKFTKKANVPRNPNIQRITQVEGHNQWIDKQELREIKLRKKALQQHNQRVEDHSRYVFKSLLRQDYFNQRFSYKQLPEWMQKQECQREVQNFILLSEHLLCPEKISYCEEITSQKSSYLLKYMPYQCSLCKKFSSEILIAQCSTMNQELHSCNSSICLQCALEFHEFMQENQVNGPQPVEECGFCGHSLILGEVESEKEASGAPALLPRASHFSNIEELDAEHDPESDTNEDNLYSNRQEPKSHKKVRNSSAKKDMVFDEINQDESLSQIPSERPANKRYELDNLVIRDATEQEKEELKFLAQESVNMTIMNNQNQDLGRCSLIQMTPRGEESGSMTDRDGFESQRSQSAQLTGLKPKALQFASPVKSPDNKVNKNQVFSTTSTKERTASGSGVGVSGGSHMHKGFGLQNCLFQCEVADNEGSPEVERFQYDQANDQLKKAPINLEDQHESTQRVDQEIEA